MADYIIVGSTAMKKMGFDIEPKDLDIFYREGTEKPKIKSYKKVEYHSIPSSLFDQFGYFYDSSSRKYYIDMESLYILKLSHAEYDIHWQKTIQHIQMLKRKLRIFYPQQADLFHSLSTKHRILFYDLKEYWKKIHHSKKRINLKMDKDKFFTDKVKRKYDHDLLHEVIKYEDEPLYKKCLANGESVLLDENKFKELFYNQKLNLCREEIYVIALERYLIPNNFNLCEHEVYKLALKKVVTKLTTGWFPTFIVDNYDKLCKIDKNYMQIFKRKIKNYV